MTIEISPSLYRYDLLEPPNDWDTNFLSPEYATKEHGHKNKANLFFFTDSKEIANDLGANAARQYFKSAYFLTSVETSNLKLIDFSNRHNIFQMLCLLQNLNIDVLTKEFRTYEDENNFGQLKIYFNDAQLEADLSNKLKIINNLKMHSNSDLNDIGLFGQRLTDFDNGIKFKELVKNTSPEFDGYKWKEFGDKRGFTHCLFDAKKLQTKKTEKILI